MPTAEAPAVEAASVVPVETDAPSPPATEVAEPTAVASEDAAPEAEAPDPYREVDKLDAKVLLERHPELKRLLDSRAGEVGDKNAKKLEKDIRARIEQEMVDRRLDEALANGDLIAAGELTKQQRDAQRAAAQEMLTQAQQAALIDRATHDAVGSAVLDAVKAMPEAVQKLLLFADDGRSPRKYAPTGTVAEGVAEFIREAVEHASQHKAADLLKAERPRLRKEIEAAVRKELNGEEADADPTLDPGTGRPAGGGAITQETFDRNRKDTDWVRANLPAIQAAYAAGRIKS